MPAPCKSHLTSPHGLAAPSIPHDQYVDQDPRQVYDMLMKNFLRVYEGDESWDGDFHAGNRAPWGLYMHAAWFFGQDWHFQGYKMFVEVPNQSPP